MNPIVSSYGAAAKPLRARGRSARGASRVGVLKHAASAAVAIIFATGALLLSAVAQDTPPSPHSPPMQEETHREMVAAFRELCLPDLGTPDAFEANAERLGWKAVPDTTPEIAGLMEESRRTIAEGCRQ